MHYLSDNICLVTIDIYAPRAASPLPKHFFKVSLETAEVKHQQLLGKLPPKENKFRDPAFVIYIAIVSRSKLVLLCGGNLEIGGKK